MVCCVFLYIHLLPDFYFCIVFTQFLFGQTSGFVNPKDIKIVRDKWGVPHIYGKTDADVIYGFAWAHAEDNFDLDSIRNSDMNFAYDAMFGAGMNAVNMVDGIHGLAGGNSLITFLAIDILLKTFHIKIPTTMSLFK